LQADAAGPFSTLGVTNILEAVANKSLLAAYNSQNVVWDQFCGIKSLTDFKTHNYYRLTISGGYSKIPPDGQIKHGEFADDKYTLAADTYGMILALTRTDIINDDLDAFNGIVAGLGRNAALAIEIAFFKLVLGSTVFSSGNANLLTGSYLDMDIAGLTAAELMFMDQVDSNGKPILVNPDRLLVGTQDSVPSAQLFNQTTIFATGLASTSALTTDFEQNPHAGKYRPVVSPIMNNTSITDMDGAAITGQSSDVWCMFGPPEVLPAILAGFLQGNRVPVVESSDTSFDTLGTQWRSYHDWAIGAGDPKGAIRSPGA
jgi:hypothetical protein